MHCHLELHQVEGMALLIREGHQTEMVEPPKGFPMCGNFHWSSQEFWDKINNPHMTSQTDVTTSSISHGSTSWTVPTLYSLLWIACASILWNIHI